MNKEVASNKNICIQNNRVLLLFVLVMFVIDLSVIAQDNPAADSSLNLPLKEKKEQKKDLEKEFKHSPHKATLYSLALPGLGQAYNKKYWKIPIVYAGFGVLGYFIGFNNNEYNKFKDAYNYVLIDDLTSPPPNDYVTKYDEAFLLSAKNFYRRNRDLSYILSGVWYIINVLDATVDAHLFNWEVDDDLSMRLEPQFNYRNPQVGQTSGGFKLTINF